MLILHGIMWVFFSSHLGLVHSSQGKGDSFASVSLPYLSWASASSPCPRKTQMPSWWTPRITVTAQWLYMTTSFPQLVRAAAPPMPMTPVPSSPPAIAPPPYLDLWTTPRPKFHGTGYTQTRLLPRTRARRTHSLQFLQSQVSPQLPLERVCAVSAEPPPCMTWRALGPTPRWHSGTDMPVKVLMN